ncbi:mechanosensitive ion channel family protein [Persephonella sp.]|nr:mechanosensitive ion channel [Aquificota bacterium]
MELQGLIDLAVQWAVKIAGAVLVFIIGKWIARKLADLSIKLMERASVEETLLKFLGKLIYVGLLILVIIAALGTLGVQTTSFIAILGAATLAIGLALQSNLSNFGAGAVLLIFRPFKVGDFVEAGGATGVVEEIGIFNTVMRTGDNRQIIIPNSNIVGGNIINYSAKDTRRIDLVIGVSYEDDLKKVKEELWNILNADERILKDPAPTVAVSELADSSVNFVVRPWVKASDYWPVYFDLLETIKTRFDEVGISIPYPQMDVHLKKED